MNTFITEIGPNGEAITFDVVSKLVNDRILFITDYIDERVATDTVAALLYLDRTDQANHISIFINSEGGDIRSVLMIYDVMRTIKSPLQTVCIGSVTHAPVILLAAGNKGMRFATKSSLLCISQLSAEGVIYSDMVNAKISFEQMKRDNKSMTDILSKLTGKKNTVITKDIERRRYMNALQAKKYNLIDHVVQWKK